VGRINSFSPSDYPDEVFAPEDMAERLSGRERLTLGHVEYLLSVRGNLIHPEVDVISTVRLGRGVRLDAGVVFQPSPDGLPNPENLIEIGDRTRVEGTEIEDGVAIGDHSLIRARFLGASTKIGPHSQLREGVTTQPRGVIEGFMERVTIGEAVKIDQDSTIETGARIDDAVKLGYATVVCVSAVIEHNATIGKMSGNGPHTADRGGIVIPAGDLIPAHSVR